MSFPGSADDGFDVEFPDTDDELVYASYPPFKRADKKDNRQERGHDLSFADEFPDTDDEICYPSLYGAHVAQAHGDHPQVEAAIQRDEVNSEAETPTWPDAYRTRQMVQSAELPGLWRACDPNETAYSREAHMQLQQNWLQQLSTDFEFDQNDSDSGDDDSMSDYSDTSSDCSTGDTDITVECDAHVISADSEDICTICLDSYTCGQQACTFPGCMHKFHKECLAEWMKRKQKCPNCRRHMSTSEQGSGSVHRNSPN